MDTPTYQIGDRVRLSQPCFGMPAGATGAITFVYPTAHNLYRVYFDRFNRACTIHSSGFAADAPKMRETPP